MPGNLYIVSTPIGNLADMTPRGIKTLSEADMIAAEDTRHSKALLTHFGIRTPLFSCHKFNEEKRGDFFINGLLEGKNIALISDAGTPCISDPGHRLVAMAAAAGVQVISVCGANAVSAALSVSGFDVTRFVFLGFLPRVPKEQKAIFHMLDGNNWPLVFYESPLRITKTITWLAEAYPTADICLCNDLTKKFERVYRGTPAKTLAELQENPNALKGEYTCVVRLNAGDADIEEATEELSLEAQLVDIMAKQKCTLKDAANILHQNISGKGEHSNSSPPTKPNKKAIYAATLRIKELFM